MSKSLKVVLLIVLLVVLGVVAFTTLGGENLLGRMKMFSLPKESQSEKPMLPASNEKKSVRVPQPKPVAPATEPAPAEEEAVPAEPTGGSGGGSVPPAEPEPTSPESSGGGGGGEYPTPEETDQSPPISTGGGGGGGAYQCPALSLSLYSSPYGSKTVSLSDILAIYDLSSQDKTTVESIIFSCDGINHIGSMLFSIYKNGNEKIGDTWTSNCKNDVTINFEPFDISSIDSVKLFIKADTTVLDTTPNDDSFAVYVSNISGHFSNNEKWTLDKCPNNSVPVYGNTLIY